MSKKCILIGMDGANPAFVLRLIEQGRLPNFERMLKEGVFAPHCLSSLPTSTPENWTTISTGAWNGTHQVMNFQVFQPPELHGNWMAGFTSKESQAEFIWDAVERAGKKSILLKYPASHPPTMSERGGVQVCGCHVRPCAHQIDGAHMFATVEPCNAALTLEPAPDNGLHSKQPVLRGALAFEARGLGAPSVGAGLDEGTAFYSVPDGAQVKPDNVNLNTPVCKLVPPGKRLYLFCLATQGQAYDRALIARDAEARDIVADLGEGQWSSWIIEPFETVDGPREGTIRFKLEALSADAARVKLYATQIVDAASTCPTTWTANHPGKSQQDAGGPSLGGDQDGDRTRDPTEHHDPQTGQMRPQLCAL